MIEASATVSKQPYLNYNEQRALESIILRVVPEYPAIIKMVLYGSKVRGDFTEESDIDLLFVTDVVLTRAMKFEISDAIYETEVVNDVVVSAIYVNERDFQMKKSSFLDKVRSEGVAVWSRE